MDRYTSKNIKQADALIKKSIKDRDTMTQEELENLRADLATVRYRISTEDLQDVSDDAVEAELEYEDCNSREYAAYLKAYMRKKNSRSTAESYARNTVKMSDSKTYEALKKSLKMKNRKDAVYQILKSLDQICNALSAFSKRAA